MSQAGDLDNGSISPDIPTEFVADMGSAVPIANVIEILGDTVAAGTIPVYTSASGNTLIANVQISQSIASSNITNVGLSAFDSSDFSVDANGFVSFIGDTGILTLTGNTGGAISPVAGNINVITSNSTTSFAGSGNTLTVNYSLSNLVFGSSLPSLAGGNNNVGLGSNVLNNVTSGTDNTAVGASALQSVNIGTLNTAFGSASSASITSGSNNNSFGRNSLLGCSTGSNNCAMGFGALGNCNSSSNTAMGHLASVNLTSGGLNTSYGANSLFACSSGVNNTSIGYSSLVACNGSDNAVFGLNAGQSYTGTESSNLLLANSGTLGESNTIRIGTQGSGSGQQNRCFSAGITGVTVAGSAPVGVSSSGQFSSLGFGTSGQVLTSNGAATSPTFQPISSSSMTWTEVSGAFASAANNGYIVTNTASTTLPASPTVGQTIEFIVDTTNILTITANTGQIFRLNTTVSATAGTAVNVARGCSITFVYAPTSVSWIASASEGNWTLT